MKPHKIRTVISTKKATSGHIILKPKAKSWQKPEKTHHIREASVRLTANF